MQSSSRTPARRSGPQSQARGSRRNHHNGMDRRNEGQVTAPRPGLTLVSDTADTQEIPIPVFRERGPASRRQLQVRLQDLTALANTAHKAVSADLAETIGQLNRVSLELSSWEAMTAWQLIRLGVARVFGWHK